MLLRELVPPIAVVPDPAFGAFNSQSFPIYKSKKLPQFAYKLLCRGPKHTLTKKNESKFYPE